MLDEVLRENDINVVSKVLIETVVRSNVINSYDEGV